MESIKKSTIEAITFEFESSNDKKRNSLATRKEATFPLSDFVKLEYTETDKPKYLVQFVKADNTGTETLEVNFVTFDMLTKVFAANNKNDYHVHYEPIIEFEPTDVRINTVTVLGDNIGSVTHETLNETIELFHVITTTGSYSISKEDYDFFRKFIIDRGERESVIDNANSKR